MQYLQQQQILSRVPLSRHLAAQALLLACLSGMGCGLWLATAPSISPACQCWPGSSTGWPDPSR
jgi:hypothetical protein